MYSWWQSAHRPPGMPKHSRSLWSGRRKVASNRLLEGLGFTLEGRLRGEWETHIGVRDSYIWGLLAAEWKP